MQNMEFRSYRNYIIFSFLLLVNLLHQLHGHSNPQPGVDSRNHEISVGIILDMGSLSGKMLRSSIFMAISDFYSSNDDYKTRIFLHTRDSKGEPLQALSLALDLLENLKVQAIIGLETLLEAKLISILGNKTEVPILSLTTSQSFISNAHPYFLQITQDETIQWKAIAAIVESFKWKEVVLVHESELGGESVACIIYSLQEKKIRISYLSTISSLATDDQIIDKLDKLANLHETVFVVHVSPSLAFRLLVHAKRLGLMSQGYAWILTDNNSMDFFDPLDLDEEVIESLQGVLGLRYHIPSSTQFRNFSRRWRKEYYYNKPNIFNVLAYDAIVALAMAVERAENEYFKVEKSIDGMMAMDFKNIQVSGSRKLVLKELVNVTFKGLSGDFHLANRKAIAKPLEIVNVVGKGERRVGFWTEADGIIMYLNSNSNHRHNYPLNGLETIIWPGGLMTPPRRGILQTSKKLRIGVPMKVGFEELLKVEYNPKTNATTAKGFCIDVFNAALEALPYEVPYEFVAFEAGTYNDLIFQVYHQNYDAAVGDITITTFRSLYVDFTIPYTDLGVGTVAKYGHNQMKIWWFIEPLDTHMWVATTCSFFIIGATIWLIEYPINTKFQGPWQDVVGSVLWFSFSTLTFSHSLSKMITASAGYIKGNYKTKRGRGIIEVGKEMV